MSAVRHALRAARVGDARVMSLVCLKRRKLQARAHVWLELPRHTFDELERMAAARALTIEEMAVTLLNLIVMDNLERAVCDDEDKP